MLELKFAALRDRLYIERMEEAAEEEELLLNGSYLSSTPMSVQRKGMLRIVSRRYEVLLKKVMMEVLRS